MISFGFSSAKVLVYLYGMSIVSQSGTPEEEIILLLPTLSESGIRSLVYQLGKKRFISTQRVSDDKLLHITAHGKEAIEARFPALSKQADEWNGKWAVMMFLSSIVSDPQFRKLRQILVSNKAGQLSRGVYVYPGVFPQEVTQQFQKYKGAIAVAEITKWQFGDEKTLITELFSLSDVIDALSGVSREVDSLLPISDKDKRAIDQRRDSFFSIFDRLISILDSDVGIHSWYFPQVATSRKLLISCCRALSL